METQESPLDRPPQTQTSWQGLSIDEKAFVAAYLENSYSLSDAAEALGETITALRRLLNRSDIRKAITEVQAEQESITFLNEKWVKTQLLKLYPKVIGEEDVPFVNGNGEETNIKRFYPDIAMRILEYVVPKDTKEKEVAATNFSFNVTLTPSQDEEAS